MGEGQCKRRRAKHRPWECNTAAMIRLLFCVCLWIIAEGAHAFSPRQWNLTPTVVVPPTMVLASSNSNVNIESDPPVGIYVHIPYCRRRCRYCDFAIVPIGPAASTEVTEDSLSTASETPQERATRGFLDMDHTYRNAILREIKLISNHYQSSSKVSLRSIYLGGGTPSLAPISTVEAIMSALLHAPDSPFVLAPNAEISMEMDPGTFSLSKLQALHKLGFNRISLGVQSFDNVILESIGRCHRYKDIMESIAMIDTVFGDDANYSIDLISGLPGVSLAKWAETLQIATTLTPKPSHMSLYDLQVEGGTVFSKWYDDTSKQDEEDNDSTNTNTNTLGRTRTLSQWVNTMRFPRPTMKECAFMYKYASGYLRAKGYEHYEISSYAHVGSSSDNGALLLPSHRRSQHNQIYWEPGGQWYAVGLGATSAIERKIFARPRAMMDYVNWVNEQEVVAATVAWLPDHDSHNDSLETLTDIVMTRLRTSDGLDLDWIENSIPGGQDIVQAILEGARLGLDLGLAQLTNSERGQRRRLRLVDPDGFLFSNSIISSIFVELGIGMED